MFGIGGQELFFIILLALIVLGPSKLPEIAKTMGKMMGEFQRATTDLKKEIDLAAEEKPKKDSKTVPEPEKQKPEGTEPQSAMQNDDSAEKKPDKEIEPSYKPDEIEG